MELSTKDYIDKVTNQPKESGKVTDASSVKENQVENEEYQAMRMPLETTAIIKLMSTAIKPWHSFFFNTFSSKLSSV